MTNRELRKDLLKKLNISKQALSNRVKKVKKEAPMSTEDATYIIAHREGLLLDKYLNQDELRHLRQIMSQVNSSNHQIIRIKKVDKKEKKTISIIGSFKGTDPILESKVLNEAKAMAAIYPLLYVLENSIRRFISIMMQKEYGESWWENQVSSKLRNEVFNRMNEENKNSWHQRRGSHPIDYLDFKDLPRLLSKINDLLVPDIIPSFEWIDQLIKEVYVSRCVLCHMNPLDQDSIDSVKLRFKQWQKQISKKIDLL
ncbi:Swt1 family HEPN domain-containing protein [Marispirochaeta aestuarii]|uniref:Swt1 family HEPN domain-containing protein n=1 Tax=Marispirochaeta aestuarii TaxID=1963862 RepID=UPI002ABDE411|nr:Swt1 family HEPN domain-containing protein [Marispirochaeta aestuarii]